MLSRLANAILIVAVVVLACALVRAHQRHADEQAMLRALNEQQQSPLEASFDPESATSDEETLMVALARFETSAFEQDQARAADSRDRSGGRASDRTDRFRGRSAPAFSEVAERCLEVAAEVDPELAVRLRDAREKNPQEFESQIRSGFGRRLWSLAQLKTNDPRLYDDKIAELSIAMQIERAAKQVRDARKNPTGSLSEVAALESKLRALLQVQVALSIKARGEMLCRFEDRARELQAELDREARNFQSTVEARMSAITADGEANPADEAAPAAAGGI